MVWEKIVHTRLFILKASFLEGKYFVRKREILRWFMRRPLNALFYKVKLRDQGLKSSYRDCYSSSFSEDKYFGLKKKVNFKVVYEKISKCTYFRVGGGERELTDQNLRNVSRHKGSALPYSPPPSSLLYTNLSGWLQAPGEGEVVVPRLW